LAARLPELISRIEEMIVRQEQMIADILAAGRDPTDMPFSFSTEWNS
jgi:hypothetical protein